MKRNDGSVRQLISFQAGFQMHHSTKSGKLISFGGELTETAGTGTEIEVRGRGEGTFLAWSPIRKVSFISVQSTDSKHWLFHLNTIFSGIQPCSVWTETRNCFPVERMAERKAVVASEHPTNPNTNSAQLDPKTLAWNKVLFPWSARANTPIIQNEPQIILYGYQRPASN